MDIVYVLGTGSIWQNNELRFSLRSLETFVEDLGQVYVVGHRPPWLTNVVFLPYPDKYACKERNIMEKMAYCCGHPDLSDTFMHVHDDHFALAPTRARELPNWCAGPLDRLAFSVKQGNHWREAVMNTHKALTEAGLPNRNFDVHYPMLFDKNLYPEVMDRYDWPGTERGFVVKSLYANTVGVEPTVTTDLKLNERLSFQALVVRLKGRPWFSLGNPALNLNLKNLLAALYPEPSKFELR